MECIFVGNIFKLHLNIFLVSVVFLYSSIVLSVESCLDNPGVAAGYHLSNTLIRYFCFLVSCSSYSIVS